MKKITSKIEVKVELDHKSYVLTAGLSTEELDRTTVTIKDENGAFYLVMSEDGPSHCSIPLKEDFSSLLSTMIKATKYLPSLSNVCIESLITAKSTLDEVLAGGAFQGEMITPINEDNFYFVDAAGIELTDDRIIESIERKSEIEIEQNSKEIVCDRLRSGKPFSLVAHPGIPYQFVNCNNPDDLIKLIGHWWLLTASGSLSEDPKCDEYEAFIVGEAGIISNGINTKRRRLGLSCMDAIGLLRAGARDRIVRKAKDIFLGDKKSD